MIIIAGPREFAMPGPTRSVQGRFARRWAGGKAPGASPPDLGACRWGLPGPKPRVTFVRTKVTKRRWVDPRPPFCPIGHYETDTGQPLNFRWAAGLLVIGVLRIRLRLTALEMIVTSYCVKNKWFYLFKRATAEVGVDTRRRSDAKRQKFSGCAVDFCRRPIGQQRRSSPKRAGVLLPTFPTREK